MPLDACTLAGRSCDARPDTRVPFATQTEPSDNDFSMLAQVNGGAMLGAGFAIPSLDASALEGKSPEEAAALATAAAAAAAAATGEPLQVAQPEQPQS